MAALVARALTLVMPIVLLLAATGGDGKPFFGLSVLDEALTNSTSLFAALSAAHAAHSLQTLAGFMDVLALARNVTVTALTG
ncbi:hypothetical protein JYU34_016196 [Plutella xylostella]|uniref:Uncharacterized protein n=1 Tax=Plutella xylostella TaxID=51655 RepID=A0ABQ7Q5N1_PLUXY|nr:hypothetical protein JYU34_016196 [Plutella xylostella]